MYVLVGWCCSEAETQHSWLLLDQMLGDVQPACCRLALLLDIFAQVMDGGFSNECFN